MAEKAIVLMKQFVAIASATLWNLLIY
uniref:Uncharacterized protein n=1 Tax=Arundo donax TaxID=35708 RepID=A0A0A9C2S3_ARUDO